MTHPIAKKIVLFLLISLLLLSSTSSVFSGSLTQYDIGIENEENVSVIGNPMISQGKELPQDVVASDDPNGDPANSEKAPEKIPIILRTNRFIPHESKPVVPELFRSSTLNIMSDEDNKDLYFFDENDKDYFMIQFRGPVKSEWKEIMSELGVELTYYIPDYAFIAFGDLKIIPDIMSEEFVNWVGPFHPYYKVQPELMELIVMGLQDPNILNQEIMISLRPVDDIADIIGAVEYIGAKIKVVDGDNYVVCDATVGMVFQLVFTRNLLWMEFHSYPELYNNKDSRILKIRQSTNGTFANDGQSLWNYNHNTDSFEGYPGNDVIVAVADTGVDGTHPTFDGKKVWFYHYGTNQENTWTDGGSSAGHGTHTSGTVLGSGAWRTSDSGEAAKYAGLAPNARLIGQAIFQGGTVPSPSKLCDDAVSHGAHISSNSWGWPGSAGNYDNTAVSYDEKVRDSAGKEFIVVFASGNEGQQSVRSPSTAKNVISVGATDNNDGESVTGFSSGGPTDDGRRRPDVVAPGQLVASSGWRDLGYGKPSDGQSSYFYATGTSMACPSASGAIAVVVDYINHTFGYIPSPALVKGILVNGASPIDGFKYPGNRQGWGRINIANSLLETPTKKIFMVNQNISLDTDDDQLYFFTVKTADTPMHISLAWTDEAGSPGGGKNLVNDLDLILETPDGKTYYGNSFSNGKSVSGGDPDDLNNVEGIYLPQAPVGGYILTIFARNVPTGPQDFALVMAGDIHDVAKGFRDIEMLPSLDFENKIHLEGDTIVLNGSFKNSGTIPTINVRYRVVHVRPDLAEENLVDNTLAMMNVDQVHYIDYKWPAVRGFHTFKIITDPFNKLREENEDNNREENSISIDHFGIETNLFVDRIVVLPDKRSTFSINILNSGSLQDTYDISNTQPPAGWVAELETDITTIGTNNSESVAFYVTPPSDALANVTVELTVFIASRGNFTYTSVIKTITVVEQYYEFHLEYDAIEKVIKPGVMGQFNILINNTANGLDTFAIAITGGKYGWDWVKSNVFVDVPARGTRNITMNVTPPADGMAGESDEIQLFVVDVTLLTRDLKLKSIIASVHIFDLEISEPGVPANVGKNITYPLRANNDGNVEDKYRFSYNVPPDWKASFKRNDISILATEFARFSFSVKVPAGELPDEYTINLTMESLSTGLKQEYLIKVEVSQYFEIQIELINIKDKVAQGETAEYEIKVMNTGTGPDSVKIDYVSIPEYWRIKIDNNVLGLTQNGTNSTRILLVTDILTEDALYTSLIRVTSAGNDSISSPKQLDTLVDHNLKYVGPTGTDDDGEDDSNGLFGLGSLFDMMIILFIIVIIVLIVLFIFSRKKKAQKVIDDLEEERRKAAEDRRATDANYKSLYSTDLRPGGGHQRSLGFATGPQIQGRPGPGAPVPVEYLGPPQPTPKPRVLPPAPQTQPQYPGMQIPLGPIPGRPEPAAEPKPKKKKVKKERIEFEEDKDSFPPVGSTPSISVKLPDHSKRGSDFDVSIPEGQGPKRDEPEFEPIKPRGGDQMEFEKRGPEFTSSSPAEWESVSSDDFQKGFEFGSGPETIDSKKKKKL